MQSFHRNGKKKDGRDFLYYHELCHVSRVLKVDGVQISRFKILTMCSMGKKKNGILYTRKIRFSQMISWTWGDSRLPVPIAGLLWIQVQCLLLYLGMTFFFIFKLIISRNKEQIDS